MLTLASTWLVTYTASNWGLNLQFGNLLVFEVSIHFLHFNVLLSKVFLYLATSYFNHLTFEHLPKAFPHPSCCPSTWLRRALSNGQSQHDFSLFRVSSSPFKSLLSPLSNSKPTSCRCMEPSFWERHTRCRVWLAWRWRYSIHFPQSLGQDWNLDSKLKLSGLDIQSQSNNTPPDTTQSTTPIPLSGWQPHRSFNASGACIWLSHRQWSIHCEERASYIGIPTLKLYAASSFNWRTPSHGQWHITVSQIIPFGMSESGLSHPMFLNILLIAHQTRRERDVSLLLVWMYLSRWVLARLVTMEAHQSETPSSSIDWVLELRKTIRPPRWTPGSSESNQSWQHLIGEIQAYLSVWRPPGLSFSIFFSLFFLDNVGLTWTWSMDYYLVSYVLPRLWIFSHMDERFPVCVFTSDQY